MTEKNKYRIMIQYVVNGSVDIEAETKAQAITMVKEHIHCGQLVVTEDNVTIDERHDVHGEVVIKNAIKFTKWKENNNETK